MKNHKNHKSFPPQMFSHIQYTGSVLLSCVTVRYPSTKQNDQNTPIVQSISGSNIYPEENQKIPFQFHHHCQAHLFHCFGQNKTSLLMHMIQYRIQVRPTWPGQNVTQLTWTTQLSFNPAVCI